jgi:hypothetical protein
MEILIGVGLVAILVIYLVVSGKNKEISTLKYDKEQLTKRLTELETAKEEELIRSIESNLHERHHAFKWLSGMIVDILKVARLKYEEKSYSLRYDYNNFQKEFDRQTLLGENRMMKYQLDYYKALMPDIAFPEISEDKFAELYRSPKYSRTESDHKWLELRNLQKKIDEKEQKLTEYPAIIQLGKDITKLEEKRNKMQQEYKLVEQKIISDILSKKQDIWINISNELNSILSDKSKSFKWFAGIMSDLKTTSEDLHANILSNSHVSTEREKGIKLNTLKNEKRNILEENAILRYQYEYIRTVFPAVDDIIEYDEYNSCSDNADNPSYFLSREEYDTLSNTEKNKKALEYYKNRKKQNWEIGRDFELYVGYKFENEGFDVTYFGIEQKLNDLGRDLIAKKKELTFIIQCKYWSREKQIHEKHLAQLYGTYIMYKLENPQENNVCPLFVTHTTLSEVAKKFAVSLGIITRENEDWGEYPLVKCNIGKDEFGDKTKIYHLPMDQQYDNVTIKPDKGDCRVFSIDEAEGKGFRRAYKWRGDE